MPVGSGTVLDADVESDICGLCGKPGAARLRISDNYLAGRPGHATGQQERGIGLSASAFGIRDDQRVNADTGRGFYFKVHN